jgi:outer membrane receptor protein involved in Fe transport
LARRWSRAILVAAVFALPLSLSAQVPGEDLPDADFEDGLLEEVIVTGTRIARRDFNTPSPLTTVDRIDIEFTVQPTIEETLNQMPQVTPSLGRSSNNPCGPCSPTGTATVDLRGFGTGRTLVLLNGRRVAPFGTGNAVDLNNIPRFLLERIEIITGGTSAVYGSDAIAGVVNFITRSDYSGVGVEAGFNIAEEGDAEVYEVSTAYGHDFSGGRGNVTVYANYLERKSVLAAAREFTRYAWIDDWEGNLYIGGSPRTPAGMIIYPEVDLGDGPAAVTFNADGSPRAYDPYTDAYNWAPVNYLQLPLTRYALGAMGHHEFADRFESYFEVSFVRTESAANLAPLPAGAYVGVNLDNPVLHPATRDLFSEHYVPAGCPPGLACFNFQKRMLEVGPRTFEFDTDYDRLLAGIRGELGGGWDLDAWLTYTTQSATERLLNDVSRTRFLQGLLVDPGTNSCFDPTGGCVPLDLFGEGRLSDEGAAFLRYAPHVNVTKRDHWLVGAVVTGSLFDTWAGPIDAAFGLEWRSDDTSFIPDEVLFTGDSLGYGGLAPVDGVDRVAEAYGEAVIPLLSGKAWADRLELEIGARYSNYEYSGSDWTYKAGFSWRIVDGLQLRAMYQKSQRAPNSVELFEEQTTGEWVLYGGGAVDPCSASADPVANGNVEKCLIQGLSADQIGVFEYIPFYPVDFYWGGNPDLVPEEGRTWTFGAVLAPGSWSDWTITVDGFWLELNDSIGWIDSELICFDPLNTEHVFCDNLIRDASGNVYQQWDLTSNRGLLKTSGVDTQVQYITDLPDWLALAGHGASLDVSFYWTHVFKYEWQDNPATSIIDCAGLFGWPCDTRAYPENRTTTYFNYSAGPLDLRLGWRWIDGTRNAAPLRSYIWGFPDPDLAVPAVSDRHYFDLGAAYRFGEHYQLRLAVNNLLDTRPPMMADQAWDQNTDSSLYDVYGRSYRLSFLAEF